MTKLYKKKYIISIYKCDGNDTLVAVLNNTTEFAEFFNITEHNAGVILNNFFKGKHNNFRYNGSLCEIYFIDMEAKDEE